MMRSHEEAVKICEMCIYGFLNSVIILAGSCFLLPLSKYRVKVSWPLIKYIEDLSPKFSKSFLPIYLFAFLNKKLFFSNTT